MPIAQNNWRYCNDCYVLFYDGYDDKGVCPTAGGHFAMGYNFWLRHDEPPHPTDQTNWRYCAKCHGMFYDGYDDKGVCPGGNPDDPGHAAAGYNFNMTHDVEPAGPQPGQKDWRYCVKCHVMFYDGYNLKGVCPGGNPDDPGHTAMGYNFILSHDISVDWEPE